MTNDIELYKLQDMIRQIERLNNACQDNMQRLNQMMLELKGIVAMVRPQVKKTGWYGEEIDLTKNLNAVEPKKPFEINRITYTAPPMQDVMCEEKECIINDHPKIPMNIDSDILRRYKCDGLINKLNEKQRERN